MTIQFVTDNVMICHLSLFDCLFLWSVHNFTTTVITTKYKIERKQPWSLFFWSFSINYRVRMELLLASMNDCVALFVAWERSLIETGCFFIFAIVPKVVVTAIFSHYHTSFVASFHWYSNMGIPLPDLFWRGCLLIGLSYLQISHLLFVFNSSFFIYFIASFSNFYLPFW